MTSSTELDIIKNEMINWKDFYGGDLPDYERILEAKDKRELQNILNDHRVLLEDMLSDALSHLDNFMRKLGIDLIE